MRIFRIIGDQHGVAIVEFALVVPVLALLTIGLAEFGFAYYAQSQVAIAAQTGLREAYANGFDSSKISNAVTNSTTQLTVSATPAPTKYCGCVVSNAVAASTCTGTNSCASGDKPQDYVSVTAAATYTPGFKLPGFPSSYNLISTAQGRLN